MSKIAIIGSGVVGTATGLGLVQLNNEVIFYDINQERLSELSKQGLVTTDNIMRAVRQSDISIVCVPTPYAGTIDLRPLVSSVKEITKALDVWKKWHLVVIKSTVVPGTTEKIVLPLLQSIRANFGLCMNPEFLTAIAASWTSDYRFQRDFWNKERIVIGALDKKSGDVLEKLYKPIGAKIFRTDLKTAEMCKYATNLMLATKISYWNEMFMVCKKLGIDSSIVAEVTSLDSRIGRYGTIHGKAFGGTCLPKDLDAFLTWVHKYKQLDLLPAVKYVNDAMKEKYGVRE